jgi:transposase
MRRCVILSAPARRRGTTFAANASSCFPSCCVTAAFTAEAAIGRRWLAGQKFEHAAQQIVFQEGIDAIEDALQRLLRPEKQLALIVPEWPMAPVVKAYQAMRGASFLVAVTFAEEIGDVRRFDTPRRLMSFLGLVPAESSTGDMIRRKGLTLAGNRRAAGAGRGRVDLSLSMHEAPYYVERAFDAGAHGYVAKREMTETLLMAIRAVLRGETYGSPGS